MAAAKSTLKKKALANPPAESLTPLKKGQIKSVQSSAPPQWPVLNTKLADITSIRPRERNPNQHPESQIAQLAQSLKERGWTMPVLVDEQGELIAGHGRLMAAHLLVAQGLKQFAQVPIATAVGWSDQQIRAYVIADNLLAQGGKMDKAILREEAQALKADGFDVSLLAMSEHQLRVALDQPLKTNEANFEFGADRFLVLIECDDEKQQEALYQELQERGIKCKIT